MSEKSAQNGSTRFSGTAMSEKSKAVSQERKDILRRMTINLRTLGFSDSEINIVSDVINKAQDDIALIKEELEEEIEGTNINADAQKAVYISRKKSADIRAMNEKMTTDIRAKIEEIIKNRGTK